MERHNVNAAVAAMFMHRWWRHYYLSRGRIFFFSFLEKDSMQNLKPECVFVCPHIIFFDSQWNTGKKMSKSHLIFTLQSGEVFSHPATKHD